MISTTDLSQMDLQSRLDSIQMAFPKEGLFAEKDWLLSPQPFELPEGFIEELEKLGYRLNLFQQACNQLYQLSAKGKQPRWITAYLDAGKPPELISLSRERIFKNQVPAVIRPDIILTANGYAITELDSVPGGMGLTAWMNKTYAALGEPVVGGAEGMLDGFASIFPDGDILVSQEAETYYPEMQWIADQLNKKHAASSTTQRWRVHKLETLPPNFESKQIYRFFEHFDIPNIPLAQKLMAQAAEGKTHVTPPFKPYLEEKMWFALFWMRPLQEYWRRALGERHWLKLQKVIPYTWIVDPAPLPHHAVIPQLEINNWRELGKFGQKERDLILKISGYSELAWGSRGVSFAADMSHLEWTAAIERALAFFNKQPRILQRFYKGKLVSQPYWDREQQQTDTLTGRVRLCPYYFLVEGKAQLSGVLATICPADKKIIHGMKDAIIVPCR